MPPPLSRRDWEWAALASILVFAVWWLTAPLADMPPIFPMGEQPVYTVADDPARVVFEPLLHAPWLASATRHAWLHGAIAFLVMAAGVIAALRGGATPLAAAVTLLALALDTSFAASLAHAAPLVIALGLVWLAVVLAFFETPRPRPRTWALAGGAMVAWTLAVVCHPTALLAWPIVVAAIRRAPARPLRGWWTPASIALGGIGVLAHAAWMAAIGRRLTLAGGDSWSWRDVLMVAGDARPFLPSGSFGGPELSPHVTTLMLALAVAGYAVVQRPRWWRRALGLSAAVAVLLAWWWSDWRTETLRMAQWAVVPLSAVGLTWVSRRVPRGLPATLAIIAIGTALIGETAVAGRRPLGGTEARAFRDGLTSALDEAIGTRAALIVAEDTKLDAGLTAWMASRDHVGRVGQDRGAIARALEDDRVVLAAPTARRHLELTGVTFREAFALRLPIPISMSMVTSTFRCATVRADRWSQLPGVDYTGRLGVELPPRLGGELQLIVGDGLPSSLRVETADGRAVPITTDALLSGPGAAAPPADYWLDGGTPENGPAFLRRVHVAADPVSPRLLSVHLGRRAPRVIARLIGFDDAARASVCAAPVGRAPLFDDDETDAMLPFDDDSVFGTGWYGREGEGPQRFRWADQDAVMLVRSARRTEVTVTLTAEAAARAALANGAHGDITLRVNGIDVGSRPLAATRVPYQWQVPAGTWIEGTNELWWHTSLAVRPVDNGGTDRRTLALSVSKIQMDRR